MHELQADGVAFTETTRDVDGTALRTDRASLRFLDLGTLTGFLEPAGCTVEQRYGDWSRGSLGSASPEVITVATAT